MRVALDLGRSLLLGVICLSIVVLQIACGSRTGSESNLPSEAQSVKPDLFTVSEEQLGHLRIDPVQRRTWHVTVQTTGTVDWDADQTTQAITQVSGPITRILVDYGSRVKAGDPLLYVASPDVTNAVAAYKKARNQQELARLALEREKALLSHGAAPTKDVESAEATYNDASTDVQNSLEALKIFAITPQELATADRQGVPISPELAVRAPITGTVVQTLVSPGQLIEAGTTNCFMLSDTSTVWVFGHIFDRDLPSVRLGDRVEETNSSFSQTFQGVVSYLGAMVDPDTRTTPVRIVTHNTRDLLKKDMYVDVTIHTKTLDRVLAVQLSAILRDEQNEPFVYVEVQPRTFARRPVTLGAEQQEYVEIRSGLSEGEKVVSEGSVFLQFANTYQ